MTLERADATTLLRWFVIQIAAYGVFALATALLNTQRRFVAVAWAPIVNNLVCIAVLLWFGLLVGRSPTLAGVADHHAQLVLLGLGTSLGVVLQCVALVPSLRSAGLGGLRWHWDLQDAALRTVMRLSGWTFGFVLANQVAQFVVILLAGTAGGSDPVSSYTYAYAFLQMPYGIVAVTVMTVVAPDLAERWSTGQRAAFLDRLSGGMRAMLALIIPSAVGMLLLAKPAVALLLGHGHSTAAGTAPTGEALAMFALGLPGFCTYLYVIRVLQSMQRTKVAFYLYLIENTINIALAVAPGAPPGRARPGPVPLRRLHRRRPVGCGAPPALVRSPRHRRDLDAAAPGRDRHGGHGGRGPGRVQSLRRHDTACSSSVGWLQPSWPGWRSIWP